MEVTKQAQLTETTELTVQLTLLHALPMMLSVLVEAVRRSQTLTELAQSDTDGADAVRH